MKELVEKQKVQPIVGQVQLEGDYIHAHYEQKVQLAWQKDPHFEQQQSWNIIVEKVEEDPEVVVEAEQYVIDEHDEGCDVFEDYPAHASYVPPVEQYYEYAEEW